MLHNSLSHVQLIPTSLGKVYVWQLLSYMEDCKTSGKRNVERSEVSGLLTSVGYATQALDYLPSGQPVLTDSQEHISISHSDGWFAVYIANEPVGVDIQVPRARIGQGKHYFLNEKERHLDDLELLHLIWGAKEALYKKYGGEMNDLRDEVTFERVETKDSKALLTYKEMDEVLFFLTEQAYFLVWT